jgi:hypothetical protein
MKNLFVLAVAGLVATSANAAEMKWSGSTGWRYEQTINNDSLNSKNTAGKDTSKATTKAHGIRANLGVTGGWENVEYGFGMRTNNAANDDHVNLQNNADRAIGIDQAWFRYLRDFGSLDLSVTFGRQKNVLAYDSVSQNLFDNDVRWDGLGWQFKFGMFGLNAAQYITGAKTSAANGQASTFTSTDATESVATTTSKFNYLLAVQPHMMWKFTDDIETMFAVGYYMWSDSSNANTMNGGYALTTNTGTPATSNLGNTLQVHNPRQWHFLNTWTLPYNLTFNAEYVMNKKTALDNTNVSGAYTGTAKDADKSALSLGLTYGSLKKAQDFTVGYAYGSKGIASVINRYTYEKFAADNKGHTFQVGYALADNFHLGWKGLFLKEKAKLNALTGVATTGVSAAQEIKTNYWELTAGVMF